MASDDSVDSVVHRVINALSTADVPYMLTGSFASTFHGAPRTTQDIDIVIAPNLGSLEKLLKQFPVDSYYVSREAALEAYGAEGLFNVVDFTSGWKVDFIICKSRSFSLTEFERRQQVELLDTTLFIASAEDTILAKLEWSKMCESERQIRDAAGVLRMQGAQLDFEYIDRWVNDLHLQDQWDIAKAQAE